MIMKEVIQIVVRVLRLKFEIRIEFRFRFLFLCVDFRLVIGSSSSLFSGGLSRLFAILLLLLLPAIFLGVRKSGRFCRIGN